MELWPRRRRLLLMEKLSQEVYELMQIVGTEYVLVDEASRVVYSRAVGPREFKRFQGGETSYLPKAILQPGTTEEISAILHVANRYGFTVTPFGGGSGLVEGTALPGTVIVDMKRFDRIEVDSVNCTVSAGAGVLGRHLEEALNQQGFTSGHFPQSLNSATVGGFVATAAVGTFSGRYGKMEDIVVGLEAVLPSGSVLQVRPIPRRSTGPHLEALLIGSEGALAIITQAELKIRQLPEERVWQAYTLADTPTGLKALRTMIQAGISPAVVRLYDEAEAATRLRRFGLQEGQALLILGFEGPRGLVDWQTTAAHAWIGQRGGEAQDEQVALDWYTGRFDSSSIVRGNHPLTGVSDALEVAASWKDIESVWRMMRAGLAPLAHTIHCHFSHIYENECSVYVIFMAEAGGDDPQYGIERYDACLKAAMEACLQAGGSISHHHGVGRTKSPWLQQEHGVSGWEVFQALKRTLDPNNILNPGSLGM